MAIRKVASELPGEDGTGADHTLVSHIQFVMSRPDETSTDPNASDAPEGVDQSRGGGGSHNDTVCRTSLSLLRSRPPGDSQDGVNHLQSLFM